MNGAYGDPSHAFGFRYLFAPPQDTTSGNLAFYAALALGANPAFYTPVLALCALVGLLWTARSVPHLRPQLFVLMAVAIVNVALFTVYGFQARRFVFATGIILVIMAAGGVAVLAQGRATFTSTV